jgi:hypothetical protein
MQGLALACAHLATTSFREAEFQRFESYRARQTFASKSLCLSGWLCLVIAPTSRVAAELKLSISNPL